MKRIEHQDFLQHAAVKEVSVSPVHTLTPVLAASNGDLLTPHDPQ